MSDCRLRDALAVLLSVSQSRQMTAASPVFLISEVWRETISTFDN